MTFPGLVERMALHDFKQHQKDAACYEMSLIYRQTWDEQQRNWREHNPFAYRLTHAI